jgi:cytochrome c
MAALLAYMTALDETWKTAGGKPLLPKLPFPKIYGLMGDATRGQATFLQKCAFCHGINGRGRYAHDTYYRPALWGDRSFRSDAGMNEVGKFAAFVHGNMPLHSGGELTDAEAWDLAAYVLGPTHCRPGATGKICGAAGSEDEP